MRGHPRGMDLLEAPGLDRADENLRRWRYGYLLRAGVGPAAAVTAAADLRWDLNALLELVGRGCPPALALRILDPFDGPAPGRGRP